MKVSTPGSAWSMPAWNPAALATEARVGRSPVCSEKDFT